METSKTKYGWMNGNRQRSIIQRLFFDDEAMILNEIVVVTTNLSLEEMGTSILCLNQKSGCEIYTRTEEYKKGQLHKNYGRIGGRGKVVKLSRTFRPGGGSPDIWRLYSLLICQQTLCPAFLCRTHEKITKDFLQYCFGDRISGRRRVCHTVRPGRSSPDIWRRYSLLICQQTLCPAFPHQCTCRLWRWMSFW